MSPRYAAVLSRSGEEAYADGNDRSGAAAKILLGNACPRLGGDKWALGPIAAFEIHASEISYRLRPLAVESAALWQYLRAELFL